MKYGDLIKETTVTTGTGDITLAGAVSGIFRTFSSTFSVGDTFGYLLTDGTANWEIGVGTMLTTTTLSRTVEKSSNNNQLVNFPAGTKTIGCVLSATTIGKFQPQQSSSFTTVVPFNVQGITYMTQQTVSSALTFTIPAGAVLGSVIYTRLVADGTNTHTFTGMKEWGGSLGYDNRNGIVNELQFLYDGYDYWYSWSQAVGATPIDVTAPTASSALVANATPTTVTITASEALDPSYASQASAFVIAGHTTNATSVIGSTIILTVTPAFVNGESKTVAYTKTGTNDIRDIAGNTMNNFSGLAITNNVQPNATGVTMTGPTSGTVGTASTNFTIGVTPVGSNITGSVVVTPSDSAGGGTFSPTTVTLTQGSPTATFTYTAGSTGAKTISVTNNGGLTNPSDITFTANPAATVPGAPTIGTATAGDASASITFTAPASNGGSAITGYTAKAYKTSDNSLVSTVTGASSPINVTGLTNGTQIYIKVAATNAVGTGAESAASNNVTPAAQTAYTITGYSGNAVRTTLDTSTSGGTINNKYYWAADKGFTSSLYWNINATVGGAQPASATAGWGTSNTTPPPDANGQNTGSSAINGLTTMGHASAFSNTSLLWLPVGSGTTNVYFWIKPVDGAAQCINPSNPMVVSGV